MKIYAYIGIIFLCLSSNLVFSQVTDSVFEKDVFMIRNYSGKRSFLNLKTSDSLKLKQNALAVKLDEGPTRYSIVPDPGNKRIALYIDDPLENLYYYYKDIFLTDGFQDELKDAKEANRVYLRGNGGKVAKMWRIKGLWKKKTVKEKPEWFKGWTTPLLNFDEYNIYTLQKIISINPVTTNEGDNLITVGKNVP